MFQSLSYPWLASSAGKCDTKCVFCIQSVLNSSGEKFQFPSWLTTHFRKSNDDDDGYVHSNGDWGWWWVLVSVAVMIVWTEQKCTIFLTACFIQIESESD